MSTLIMKFGGSSIGTPMALTQVLSIVLHEQHHWERLVLVASALEGVTDMLLEAAYLAQVSNQRGYRRIAATLRTRHLAIVEQLPLGTSEKSSLQADIDRLLFEMLDVCQSVSNTPHETLPPATTDVIVSVGEKLAARIIAGLLRQNNLLGVAIDGTDLIITDSVHGNANPDYVRTTEKVNQLLIPMLGRKIIPVVTGFIGSTPDGKTTTMGRGGSDMTATTLAVCIHASEVWIWSDVDGMMSADPKEISQARVIPTLSYNEVAELAYFGARILHARMIAPLQERAIPLRIKNVYKPQLAGTLIQANSEHTITHPKAVTAIQSIGLFAPYSGVVSPIIQTVDTVLFSTIGTHADVMISAQSANQTFLCFIIPTSAGVEAVDNIKGTLAERLNQNNEPPLWTVKPLSVVSIIGEHLDEMLATIGQMMQSLQGIRLLGLAQAPSHCGLSFIVEQHQGEALVERLHDFIIG